MRSANVTRGNPVHRQAAAAAARPVYFVSNRPEAYEIWGEVDHDAAQRIGSIIARRAAERFPEIEFRVDADWHEHPPGMALVAAYIEGAWQSWIAGEFAEH